jgi:GTPase involved in cell partitioning and DNA repair
MRQSLASRYLTSLSKIQKLYIGESGESGEANFKKGKSAEHLIVEVTITSHRASRRFSLGTRRHTDQEKQWQVGV